MSPPAEDGAGRFARLDAIETPWVRRFARQEERSVLRALMLGATRAADGWILILVVPAALLVDPHRALAATLVGLLAGLTLAAAVAGLKLTLRRQRPVVDLDRPITAYDKHSFPSGHSAHALSAAIFVLWVWPPLGAVALLGVPFVGASRVFFGLHYPSDVLAGWTLGTALACSWIWLADRFGLFAAILELDQS